MKRVTGIGGIFFRSDEPTATRRWYREHLGIESGEHGATFEEVQDPGAINPTG